MPTMTDDQWRAFVSTGTRTGKLATVSADGGPHVAPVWFDLDGDDLVFHTRKGSVKARNLARDPRAVISVDNDRPPFSFVLLRGRATTSDDPGDVRYWARRLAVRYVGEARAREYAVRNSGPETVVVRIPIEEITSFAEIADRAADSA
ncbi:PPOX class F420-dependent oxidoreductase [Nocardia sp. NPDC055321]